MNKRSIFTVEVDSHSRFLLPAEVAKRYGFTADAKVRLEEDSTGFRFSSTFENLARV